MMKELDFLAENIVNIYAYEQDREVISDDRL